jgi:hypothetical protein
MDSDRCLLTKYCQFDGPEHSPNLISIRRVTEASDVSGRVTTRTVPEVSARESA